MNHTGYSDGRVIVFCLRDIVIPSLSQRVHCLLVFIFFAEARQKLV